MNFFWHTLAVISMALPSYLGYNLVFGRGKILHFGPEAVSIVAGYTVFILLMRFGSGYVLAIAGGFVAVTLLCLLLSWIALRLEPDAFGVISLALHLMLIAVVLNWTSMTRGALGIPGLRRFPFLNSPFDFAMFGLIVAVPFVFLLWKVDRGPFGRKLMALAEHEWHAQSLGISRAKAFTVAFLLSGFGMLLTMTLIRQYHTILHPNDFGFPYFIFMVMVIVAGKPGSVLGVTLSTVLLSTLKEALRFVPLAPSVLGPLRLILFGCILFAVVWWRRDVMFPRERKV